MPLSGQKVILLLHLSSHLPQPPQEVQRILIVDEATSSVDTRTEIQLQEVLLRLLEGRTAFVIAHRLSTIRKADLVLVVNDHRIIERGTHKELLAQKGFYYDLYMSQFRQAEAAINQPGPAKITGPKPLVG
jgi:ATP-binding cassette subfamily B protein